MLKLTKYILFFILFVTVLFVKANEKIDSLEHVIENTMGEGKVDAMLLLFEEYQYSDFDNALRYSKDALKHSEKIGYKYGIALAHNNIGYSLTDLGEFNEAMDHYNIAIKLFKELKEGTREAVAYNDIAYIYQSQGLIKKAIEYYIKSLKLLEKFDDRTSEAACLGNIGLLYHDQKNYEKALEYYNQGLKIKEAIGNEQSIGVSLNNIGSIYFEKNELFEAKEYFFKSLVKRKKVNDKPGIAQSLTNIAAVFREQKEFETALEYLMQAKEIQIELNDKIGLAGTYNSIGVIYNLQGNTTEAKPYLEDGYQLAKSIGSPILIKNSAIALSNLYRHIDRYEDAFKMIIEHYQMADSLKNNENTRKIAQVGLEYEFEKKLHESELAQIQKNHEHEIDMKDQKTISYTLAIGIAGLVILSLVILKSLNTNKKANKRITQQKLEIEEKSFKLEDALTSITDSVIYAKRIQQALLQTEEHISNNIPPHFIFFKPKDIVSGDFYWAYEKEDSLYIAAVDCTGHGVPGALMSMLGITFLNNINTTDQLLSPNEILNELRNKVVTELGQGKGELKFRDGMDISLSKINIKTNEVEWAGANNPLWIIRDNEVEEIKGDRQAINYNENPIPYTNHKIKLSKGDQIYMFTDGYPDQFGGPKGKKFKYKEFKKLLLSFSSFPIQDQKEKLNQHFTEWKGNLDQIDDVCVIGLQL